MTEAKVYGVPETWSDRTFIDEKHYREMYQFSLDDPEAFWRDEGMRIDWIQPYGCVKNTSFGPGKVSIKWYEDGTLNVAANCIDRHLKTRGNQVAILWEGDDPKDDAAITFSELHEKVCRFANVLKNLGVNKGDRVTIYMPMIPGGRLRHAGLCAYRRGSFGCVRRLFARFARRAHRGLQIKLRHHGGRGRARRACDPAEEQHR